MFAIAHALHELIEGRKVTSIDGDELLSVLTQTVSFQGVTGLVAFQDASSDRSRMFHGDRTAGIRYDVRNFAASELRIVGSWTPCAACSFDDRWAPNGAPMTYSTADGSRPFDGSEVALLARLTDERVDFGEDAKDMACAALLAISHANARDGSLVPQLSSIRSNFRVSARVVDIQATAKGAVNGYREAQSANVDGIVDGASSNTNVFMAQLGSLDALPQVRALPSTGNSPFPCLPTSYTPSSLVLTRHLLSSHVPCPPPTR